MFDLARRYSDHPISFLEYGTPVAEARGVVVILHGHAEDETMAWEMLGGGVPEGALALVVRATFPYPKDPTKVMWFDVTLPPEPRTVNLQQEEESRSMLADLLTRLRTEPDLAGKPIALLAFSQGGMMALHLALQRPDLMDAVAVAPARLMDEQVAGMPKRPEHQGKPVFWAQPDRSPIMFPAHAESGCATLTEYGMSVTRHDYSGGHEVPPDVVARMRAWLEVVFV